jgi:hypothetical protein
MIFSKVSASRLVKTTEHLYIYACMCVQCLRIHIAYVIITSSNKAEKIILENKITAKPCYFLWISHQELDSKAIYETNIKTQTYDKPRENPHRDTLKLKGKKRVTISGNYPLYQRKHPTSQCEQA